MARSCAATLLALLAWAAPAAAQSAAAADRLAVERIIQAYRTAWLANDRAQVMATLTADATLYPSTLAPVAGADAIARFWFPATGPATRVTALEAEIDDVLIHGDVAVVSGRGSLTFVTSANGVESEPRTQRHWHVNVLRRQRDGRWLIWKRMWGDLRS
jgi:uncharacterized protein (TIGR02246 family)